MPNTNPMVITLGQYNLMREQFKQHYFMEKCNSNFGGQDIQIPWSSFSLVVTKFIKTIGAAADTIALRFVHCYDTAKNELYLRLQICTMELAPGEKYTYNLVTTHSDWYTIENGSIAPTDTTSLFDQNYLNNFYYCNADICSSASCVSLTTDTAGKIYVRSLVFPWAQEVQQIYTDNGAPANAIICFAAGSEDKSSPVCEHPHGLAIYLRKHDGTPLLDNKDYPEAFKNKAGDLATLCPVNCGVYILPQG